MQTWPRDTHGLFDYDTRTLVKQSLKTTSSCTIERSHHDIRLVFGPRQQTLPDTTRYMVAIQLLEGRFSVAPVWSVDSSVDPKVCEKTWLTINSLKTSSKHPGYRLCEGDVLKLGKLKLRVKEVNASGAEDKLNNFSLEEMMNNSIESEDSDDEEEAKSFALPCRVCLHETYTEDNPLLSPCNCAGTMKYIHLKCLQIALKSKITSRASEMHVSLEWKSLACDLCMKPYPYKLEVNGKLIQLIDIPKPPGRYIIFEILCKDKESNRGLHIVSLYSNSVARVGRSNECQFKINDISVSRNHASLQLLNGAFFIDDAKSKFGTLVQVKRPLPLDSKEKLTLQIGRSVAIFSLKRPWSLLPACFRSDGAAMEGFAMPVQLGITPVLPFNTGIPLSVANPQLLIANIGGKYKANKNLLFEHCQLGYNSSCEDELEEVDEVRVAPIADESMEVRPELDLSYTMNAKQLHSFSYN